MSDLPRRVPGAHLNQVCLAPTDGWFATDERWPTEDPDSAVLARYFGDGGGATALDAEVLLRRVLDGLDRLGADPSPGTRFWC